MYEENINWVAISLAKYNGVADKLEMYLGMILDLCLEPLYLEGGKELVLEFLQYELEKLYYPDGRKTPEEMEEMFFWKKAMKERDVQDIEIYNQFKIQE